jgi:CPA2 family monovalent cation:H+ antiporter-2
VEKIEALVIGLRRVGGMACDFLTKHEVRYIAIDRDLTLVDGLRKKGVRAFLGNGADPLFLLRCGIHSVKSVIITSHSREEIDAVVNAVRQIRKDVRIISRAHDADHAKYLYRKGVSVAVPETIEASLQLSEAALLSLDRDDQEIRESIDEQREAIRDELLGVQKAL